MPYHALRNLVERIFSDLNAANVVPTPAEVWNAYASEIAPLLALPGVQGEFTVLGAVFGCLRRWKRHGCCSTYVSALARIRKDDHW
jgi:hypothetical protein